MSKEHSKIVCQNRKARHDYTIEDTLEAGIMLLGPEVKSLREGRGNLTDSYADYKNGEIWLYNTHISPYAHATDTSIIDPLRPRKLLLHKKESRKLIGKIKERGYALIPLSIYFKNGKAKVELALAKGKKQHDKRQAMKEKDLTRELSKQFKVR